MTTRAWVNGRLTDADEPVLLANDHGLTVGDGVFETCKILRGEVYALTRHLNRLARSAAGLALPEPDLDRIRAGVAELLAAEQPIAFGRLRITVTGGSGPLGSERLPGAGTCVLQAAAQEPPAATGAAVVVPWVRNERSAVAGIKTTSYAENVVALAYAKARGASEALLANSRGDLCEGTGSNVFVAVGGELVTPPLSAGPLAGISRGLLLEWAADSGLPVREGSLPIEILGQAATVLLTSSIRDVQPVHSLDGRALDVDSELAVRAVSLFAERAADGMDP
ncbi:MAG: aminotransferase class IV [Actinomycetota bacterium]|nr:aminotransferase class IV [Actinomycetota bacterium]